MSQVWPLQEAIASGLLGYAPLAAIIGDHGVYSIIAPSDAALPYIVLGGSTEEDWSVFGKKGYEGTEQVIAYSEEMNKMQVALMYSYIEIVLDRKILTLSIGVNLRGRTSLLAIEPDEGGQAMRAISLYRAHSR